MFDHIGPFIPVILENNKKSDFVANSYKSTKVVHRLTVFPTNATNNSWSKMIHETNHIFFFGLALCHDVVKVKVVLHAHVF